jgi:hypothetical protein
MLRGLSSILKVRYGSRADAAELMSMAHIEVFGQTIEERKNHKENVKIPWLMTIVIFSTFQLTSDLKSQPVKNVAGFVLA